MTSMSGAGSAALALLLAAAASGSACAMNSTSTEQLRCVVQGEEQLPAELDVETICSAIRSASAPALASAAIPASAVSVLVEVRSGHGLSATATVSGTALRERHVATSNRPLNARAVKMLADAVAAELSTVKKR